MSATAERSSTAVPAVNRTTVAEIDARLEAIHDEIERLTEALEILRGRSVAGEGPHVHPTSEDVVDEAIVRSSVLAKASDIARYLQAHLGQQLTAYLAGLKDPKMVGQWARQRSKPPAITRERLRVAYAACQLFVDVYDDDAARAWFFGANSSLDYRAPASVLRDAETPDQLAAIVPLARAFVRGAH